jgi:hypothetical protein
MRAISRYKKRDKKNPYVARVSERGLYIVKYDIIPLGV